MPNWCSIQFNVQGTPEALAAFKAGVAQLPAADEPLETASASPLREFDFNRLIPMPRELQITAGSQGDLGYDAFFGDALYLLNYPWVVKMGIDSVEALREYLKREQPDCYEQGKRYHKNLVKYGFKHWYDWANANWGTKWNAGSVELEEADNQLTYRFDTAWSFPEPVFEALADAFPGITLEGTADEEAGFFYLDFTIKQGVLDIDCHAGYRPGCNPYADDEATDEEFNANAQENAVPALMPAPEATVPASAVPTRESEVPHAT